MMQDHEMDRMSHMRDRAEGTIMVVILIATLAGFGFGLWAGSAYALAACVDQGEYHHKMFRDTITCQVKR